MRILMINSVHYGSTGSMMLQLAEQARENGHTVLTAFSGGRHCHLKKDEKSLHIGGALSEDSHLILDRLTGNNGCYSKAATARFLKEVERFRPDVIHLHNLHNCYINLPMLFSYIRDHGIRTVWTLHDCWPFTGHCPHFIGIGCEKWKTGCHDCAKYREYPKSFVDSSGKMWKWKKEWFSGIPQMAIVTPSEWLSGLVRQSFLNGYDVRVIHNGIDLDILRPRTGDFPEKYGLTGRKIVLGVSFNWEDPYKGLHVFRELAKMLPEDYRIVLVGTDEKTEKTIPENILTIRKTADKQEIAEIYSAADVLLNPTKQDNYPTVDMEAIACGTPVITTNVGGGPEIVTEGCGIITETEDLQALKQTILQVCTDREKYRKVCLERAKDFDRRRMYSEYLKLYTENTDG